MHHKFQANPILYIYYHEGAESITSDASSSPSPSMYGIKNDAENPRYDETHCYDRGQRLKNCFYKSQTDDPEVDMEVPFERSVNYEVGNTCIPPNYFKYTDNTGGKKTGCILRKNLNELTKPTFYYLKRFLDFVNNEYRIKVINKLEQNFVKRFELIKDGDKQFRNYTGENKNLLNFHIHLKTISSENKSLTKGITLFPLLKVKFLNSINKNAAPPNDKKYTEYDYTGNVNNLCQVVNFINDKVKINFSNDTLDFKLFSKLYSKKLMNFQSDYEIIDILEGVGNDKELINSLFEDFKTELDDEFNCPGLKITPYNLNQKMRDQDAEDKINPLSSYLINRPKLYFDNADIIDSNKGNLMVFFKIIF